MPSYSNNFLRFLNKITPDSFYSSAKSILSVNVVSSDILDIFVTLIFQKASNEPNFTYLYSQLCVILCEKSRNFETDNIYTSFKLLLLKRCETEFFKRHSIDFNNPVQRQRSIGAIRFIAYLGVDNAIPHRILHDCVRTLLLCKSTTSTNQTPPISTPQDSSAYPKENEEISLDMECLCEFMKIAGSHLDTPKARNLMNQYFGRMVQIVERASPERLCEIRNGVKGVKFVPLSTRIRYMITDVVDLRKNNWKPLFDGQLNDCGYPWHAEDLIREYEEALLTYPRSSSAIHVGGSGADALDQRSLESGTASSSISSDWTTLNQMGKALCSRRGNKDIDLFASSSNSNDGGASNLYSASNLTTRDGSNGGNCGASVWGRRNAVGGIQEKRGSTPLIRARKSPTPVSKVVRSNNNAALFEPGYVHSTMFPLLQKSQDHVRGSGGATSSCASSAAVTPATASPDIDAMITGRADVRQLSSSSLSSGGGGLPHNHGGGIWRPSRLYSMYGPSHQPSQPPGIITYAERPVHVDENKEAAKSIIAILSKTKNIQEATDQLADKELLSKLNKEVILKCMLLLCDVSSKPISTGLDLNSKRAACQFTSLLLFESKHRESLTPSLENSWSLMLQRLSATSSKTAPAFLAARLILTGQLSLAKVAEPLTAGRHYPLYLLTLQQLGKMADSSSAPGAFLLVEENDRVADDGEFIPEGVDFLEGCQEERRRKLMKFLGSWVVLEEMLPEGSQSPTQILEILEERDIDFFVPHLRLVVRTLCPLLTFGYDLRTFADHLPTLKDHLSTELVHALIGAAYERVWLSSSKIEISCVSEEELEDIEEAVWREMMEEGKLGKCVPDDRQLDVLHALQVFWNDKGMPKGFMLRCFQNLYHFSLVDKPVFFEWQKEENQTYPVKGKALFEVMRWLKWLETVTESEDSSVDSDDTSEETNSPQGNHIAGCDLKKEPNEAVSEKTKSFTLALNHFVNDGGDNFNETTKTTSENSE
ncbi:unnamed protein product [Rodentolepis nana]|uniref:Eukaryotic translation initiation factor 4 gamma 2 n=1 Tax=Rodentolepis nana TaxID=102285 RepID=A0A158QHP3_RODNA|nr:unnamed protein product [Rodentolepis nana]